MPIKWQKYINCCLQTNSLSHFYNSMSYSEGLLITMSDLGDNWLTAGHWKYAPMALVGSQSTYKCPLRCPGVTKPYVAIPRDSNYFLGIILILMQGIFLEHSGLDLDTRLLCMTQDEQACLTDDPWSTGIYQWRSRIWVNRRTNLSNSKQSKGEQGMTIVWNHKDLQIIGWRNLLSLQWEDWSCTLTPSITEASQVTI